jgi:membrane-associated protease RseP (regulator of RpoE activity)
MWTRRGHLQGNGARAACAALMALVLLAGGSASAAGTKDRAALEKQLADARSRLDDAARDVADLSRQLYGSDVEEEVRMVHRGGPQGAMLGVNIGGADAREEGVEVAGVSPAGPAQAAGLRAGDVIVAVDGKSLRKSADRSPGRQLVEYMRGVQPGRSVKVDYLRDGKRMSAAVVAAPAEPAMVRIIRETHLDPLLEGMMPPGMMEGLPGFGRGFGALELVAVTPKLGQYFGTDKGLLVVRVPAESTLKLEEGDVILGIDGRVPENPGHAFRILGSYQPGEKVKLEVLRNRKRSTVEGTIPNDEGMGGHPAMPPHPMRMPPPGASPPPPAPPTAPTGKGGPA